MSTPTRLSDNRALRAMTVQQADALFQEIALLTVKIEKTKAQYEKRIAELKAAAGRDTEAPEAELREKVATLNHYTSRIRNASSSRVSIRPITANTASARFPISRSRTRKRSKRRSRRRRSPR